MDQIKALKRKIKKFSDDRDWNKFHSPKNLAMALSVEVAEVLEIFQWLTENESKRLTEKKLEMLKDELADTYIYLLKLADHYGVDLISEANRKIKKSALKYPVHKFKGKADKYTEL